MGRNQQHRTGRTRGRRIFIRVSDQEFEEIRAAADMKGVSVSRYLVEAQVVPEKLRTLDHGRPWSDDQFASTRLSSSRDMSR